MPDAICATCPFWSHLVDSPEGQCRVRSPAAYTVEMASVRPPRDAWWPYTRTDSWCGEHPLRQRDRLAAMAIAVAPFFGYSIPGESPAQEVARRSYEIADAMLQQAAGERVTCPPGCQGIEIEPGVFSGCGCPEGKLANGKPWPAGFVCDCPNHPQS